jgi:hypothetical protein
MGGGDGFNRLTFQEISSGSIFSVESGTVYGTMRANDTILDVKSATKYPLNHAPKEGENYAKTSHEGTKE